MEDFAILIIRDKTTNESWERPISGDNLVIGREALARSVRATSGYQGVTGVISFDERGDRVP